MSYFISPTPIKLSTDCKKPCNLNFNEKCKCFPTNSLKSLQSFTLEKKLSILNKNQICAHQVGDFLIPCGKGCCDEGCPGECDKVKPRPPEEYPRSDSIFKNVNDEEFKPTKYKRSHLYIKEIIRVLLVISVIIIINLLT